jgi:serine O-acetyltransferase
MLKELISDSFRKYGKKSYPSILLGFLFSRTHRVVITLRACQYFNSCGLFFRPLLFVFKIIHKISCHLACIDLSWKTQIGSGFAITHGWGVVINEGATIGSNVTIFHGATIGRADRISPSETRTTGYPTIEDDVWIGPNAIIVGGITIGKGCRIAGGAFVSKNIPPHSLVVGNPGNVVKTNITPDVFNRFTATSINPLT